jgi:hypothetical protein
MNVSYWATHLPNMRLGCYMVGCVYKIISKVLANKLKSVLEKVISKTLNTFIMGR